MKLAWVLVVSVGLSGSLLGSQKPGDLKRNYAPLGPEPNAEVLLQKRYELELRRAGGPRTAVVDEILGSRVARQMPSWSNKVLKACADRLIDCVEFAAAAQERIRGLSGKEREVAEYDAALFKKEAALQALTMRQRRALYLQTLKGDQTGGDGFQLNAWDAAQRALAEGMYDLIPEIERVEKTWAAVWRDALEKHLKIARALRSSAPKDELIRLVRAGVSAPPDSQVEITARLALNELRKLNAPGTAEDLKEVVALYTPRKEKLDRELKEKIEASRAQNRYLLPGEIPLPTAYLEFLGWEIAEAIGDLGNREFERKILGGRTLWDQVNEAERELLRQGKLRPNEMVSK